MAKAVILIAMLSLSAITGNALPTDFYASSSALSQGKWARVQVKESGMQLISNSTLKSLGFTDPDKVNVYGFGGRMLSERLNESMPDDLPVVPQSGLLRESCSSDTRVFYGVLIAENSIHTLTF